MEYVAIALCILLLVILAHHFGLLDRFTSQEHAQLAPPDFRTSMVQADRGRQRDEDGLTVTDYILEANMMHDLPLSERVAIRG